MFKEKKFLKYRRLQKNRIIQLYYKFINFKLRTFFQTICILYSLVNVKIFLQHLKLFRFFFNRLLSISRHSSRKERFKRASIKAESIQPSSLGKKGFFYKKFLETVPYLKKAVKKKLKFKFFHFKKKKSIRKLYLFLNIWMLPYTKKAVGSRMGKGKGAVKNWFFRIQSGWPIFFFKNWNINVLRYGIRKLKIWLPGKWLMYYYSSMYPLYGGFLLNLHNIWAR